MGIVIETPPDNVALSIALSVLLLSVVLHPLVRACFHRVRADRAWKTIEKREPVEVTKYSFFSEALGDRGKWDTARAVTFMLAAFHVATWGLELSLDLALKTDGPVDLLNRPPPIASRTKITDLTHNSTDWMVQASLENTPKGGTLGNFHGTLASGNATATYRVGDTIINGNTLFASWSAEPTRISSSLFYDMGGEAAVVEAVNCSIPARKGAVYLKSAGGDSEIWGDATECESGPKLVNASEVDRASPPTIFLKSMEDILHLVVEEESSYPSFLYSVWKPETITAEPPKLHFVFYIASTTRLAEAIVTGVVNGIMKGGGCVDLLVQYSVANQVYVLEGAKRVSPFGEHPRSSSVDSLDQVEPIVAGVQVSTMGTVCGVLLIFVTASAFIGCIFSHSRRSLDVYDRDEMIRAISLPSGEGEDGKPAALKIYVRQQEDGAFSIIISDDGVYRGCAGMRKRLHWIRDSDRIGPISSSARSISRSGSVPVQGIELGFDGVRPSMDGVASSLGGPHYPQECTPARPRSRASSVVELIASPVPGLNRSRSVARELARSQLNGSSPKAVFSAPKLNRKESVLRGVGRSRANEASSATVASISDDKSKDRPMLKEVPRRTPVKTPSLTVYNSGKSPVLAPV